MNKTKIEWTDYTWNPMTGCENNCSYCYAEKIAKRFFPQGFEPSFYPERLSEKFPGKPSRIFTCSMADLFGDWNPDWQINDILDTIRLHPEHQFQLLTKQPQNLIKFSPFPDNAWVGVSATNQEQWDKALYYLGYHIEAKVKYISVEPFLNPITTSQSLLFNFDKNENMINQIIIGAQTNPTVMPKIEWVQEIVEAADRAGIPVFLKDSLGPLLAPAFLDAPNKYDMFFTRLGSLRKEMPK